MSRLQHIIFTALAVWVVLLNPVRKISAQDRDIRFEIKWSNDFFFQTDRYYSNGFDVALYLPGLEGTLLDHLLVQPSGQMHCEYGITLSHHFFTPDNLVTPLVDKEDRPYASYLLAGVRKTSKDPIKRLRMESELQLGILGRYSGGQLLQNGIHAVLAGSEPSMGWDNQLEPGPAVNYRLAIAKGIISGKYSDALIVGTGRLGIPYTDATLGVQVNLGKNIRPYECSKDQTGWGFILGSSVGFVGYNATLQGGFPANNVHVLKHIHRVLGSAHLGFVYRIKGFEIEAGAHWLTPEYPSALTHRWGYVSFEITL